MKQDSNKKYIVIIIILLVILGILGFGIFNHTKKKNTEVDVIISKPIQLEINAPTTVNSLNLNFKNGTLLNGNEPVDTYTLGNKSIALKLENQYGYPKEYTLEYNVVDTIAPTISNVKEITVQINGNLDLWNGIEVTDNSNSTITTSIEGEYDIATIGNYKITFVAIDAVGNEAKETTTLKVVAKYVPDLTHVYIWEDQVIETSKGYQIEIINNIPYINGILITNKTYSIPPSFGNGITSETASAFKELQAAAAAEGHILYNSSGYRSYDYQKQLYNNYCAKWGQSEADTFSARPGFSEHQTGMAIDLNTIARDFGETPEGQWVAHNIQNYGFILRYPEGKDHITGYIYEPWHIRYVGVELAQELYNDGDWISMEEYFGIDSVYPEDYAKQTN